MPRSSIVMDLPFFDYRTEDPNHPDAPKEPREIKVSIDERNVYIDLKVLNQDDTISVWVELQGDHLVAHAYDPEHEEPVDLRIGTEGIEIHTNRKEGLPK